MRSDGHICYPDCVGDFIGICMSKYMKLYTLIMCSFYLSILPHRNCYKIHITGNKSKKKYMRSNMCDLPLLGSDVTGISAIAYVIFKSSACSPCMLFYQVYSTSVNIRDYFYRYYKPTAFIISYWLKWGGCTYFKVFTLLVICLSWYPSADMLKYLWLWPYRWFLTMCLRKMKSKSNVVISIVLISSRL